MWTQDDLDRVQTALANGQRSVTFADGRKIEYQSTREMLDLRRQMKIEIETGKSSKPLRRVTVARMGRRR